MKAASIFVIGLGLAFTASSQSGSGQSTENPDTATRQTVKTSKKKNVKSRPGPGREAANGGGDIAKGAGKGAGDLVTLRPIRAAGAVGKGAGEGTYKIGRGIGGGIGKIFHHPHHKDQKRDQE